MKKIGPIGKIGLISLIGLILAPAVLAQDFVSDSFKVKDPVIEGTAAHSTSTSFQVWATIPYISTNQSTSTTYKVDPAFEGFPSNDATSSPVTTPNTGQSPSGPSGGGSAAAEAIETLQTALDAITLQLNNLLATLLPGIFTPRGEPTSLTELEKAVPRLAPLALRGIWTLLPEGPIRELAFSPLPADVLRLAAAFPELGKLFKEVGITRLQDLPKLKGIRLSIPGVADILEIPSIALGGQKVIRLEDLKTLAELAPNLRSKLPLNSLFTRVGGGKIDVQPILKVGEGGTVHEQISLLAGKPIALVVRPEGRPSSVKGYLIFKSRSQATNKTNKSYRSYISIAKAAEPEIETALVLQEFEFTDPDGDGLYTASVNAPVVSGSYEILTVISYADGSNQTKALRLLTVVDPEGYIYERQDNKELRIPGAIVTLEWLNPDKNEYALWPAEEFAQENPQITNETGQYSFLVPEGFYRLTVEAPGYTNYEGKPFQISTGSSVHQNIPLKTRLAWLRAVDAQTVILVLLGFLLLYNFYRDKIRERKQVANSR